MDRLRLFSWRVTVLCYDEPSVCIREVVVQVPLILLCRAFGDGWCARSRHRASKSAERCLAQKNQASRPSCRACQISAASGATGKNGLAQRSLWTCKWGATAGSTSSENIARSSGEASVACIMRYRWQCRGRSIVPQISIVNASRSLRLLLQDVSTASTSAWDQCGTVVPRHVRKSRLTHRCAIWPADRPRQPVQDTRHDCKVNPDQKGMIFVPLQAQELPEEVAFDIEKDVNRTFPEVAKCVMGCCCDRRPAVSLCCSHSCLWGCVSQVCDRQGGAEPHERPEGLCSTRSRGERRSSIPILHCGPC